MKKEISRFFAANPEAVYNAYLKSITEKFSANCTQKPHTRLSFSLSFSVGYNMNGGTCTLDLKPYNDGTAVVTSYSVLQLIGARCDKHEEDLSNFAGNILGIKGQRISNPFASSGQSNTITEKRSYVYEASRPGALIAFYIIWTFLSFFIYLTGKVVYLLDSKTYIVTSILIGWVIAFIIVLLWFFTPQK